MTTVSTTIRTRPAAPRIPRFLIVLVLAIALVAIPTFSPTDADAYPTSERLALRSCGALGGRVHYVTHDYDFERNEATYTFTCTSPSGWTFFNCLGWDIALMC